MSKGTWVAIMLAVAVVVVGGGAFFFGSGDVKAPVTTPEAAGIRVQSATYGGSCGVPVGNATAAVRNACAGRANCEYAVDVRELGDLAPGCGKDFSVEYACGVGSPAKTATIPVEAHGGTARLSCP
jgi:hypothetical protein